MFNNLSKKQKQEPAENQPPQTPPTPYFGTNTNLLTSNVNKSIGQDNPFAAASGGGGNQPGGLLGNIISSKKMETSIFNSSGFSNNQQLKPGDSNILASTPLTPESSNLFSNGSSLLDPPNNQVPNPFLSKTGTPISGGLGLGNISQPTRPNPYLVSTSANIKVAENTKNDNPISEESKPWKFNWGGSQEAGENKNNPPFFTKTEEDKEKTKQEFSIFDLDQKTSFRSSTHKDLVKPNDSVSETIGQKPREIEEESEVLPSTPKEPEKPSLTLSQGIAGSRRAAPAPRNVGSGLWGAVGGNVYSKPTETSSMFANIEPSAYDKSVRVNTNTIVPSGTLSNPERKVPVNDPPATSSPKPSTTGIGFNSSSGENKPIDSGFSISNSQVAKKLEPSMHHVPGQSIQCFEYPSDWPQLLLFHRFADLTLDVLKETIELNSENSRIDNRSSVKCLVSSVDQPKLSGLLVEPPPTCRLLFEAAVSLFLSLSSSSSYPINVKSSIKPEVISVASSLTKINEVMQTWIYKEWNTGEGPRMVYEDGTGKTILIENKIPLKKEETKKEDKGKDEKGKDEKSKEEKSKEEKSKEENSKEENSKEDTEEALPEIDESPTAYLQGVEFVTVELKSQPLKTFQVAIRLGFTGIVFTLEVFRESVTTDDIITKAKLLGYDLNELKREQDQKIKTILEEVEGKSQLKISTNGLLELIRCNNGSEKWNLVKEHRNYMGVNVFGFKDQSNLALLDPNKYRSLMIYCDTPRDKYAILRVAIYQKDQTNFQLTRPLLIPLSGEITVKDVLNFCLLEWYAPSLEKSEDLEKSLSDISTLVDLVELNNTAIEFSVFDSSLIKLLNISSSDVDSRPLFHFSVKLRSESTTATYNTRRDALKFYPEIPVAALGKTTQQVVLVELPLNTRSNLIEQIEGFTLQSAYEADEKRVIARTWKKDNQDQTEMSDMVEYCPNSVHWLSKSETGSFIGKWTCAYYKRDVNQPVNHQL